MAKEIRAIVDVGTNATKLLVAEVSDGTVKPIFEASEVTQLGQGLFPISSSRRAINKSACAEGRPPLLFSAARAS